MKKFIFSFKAVTFQHFFLSADILGFRRSSQRVSVDDNNVIIKMKYYTACKILNDKRDTKTGNMY